MVLGIYDRCTPKLASDASRAVAMLSSLAEAQAQLRSEGIALDIKTLRSTAYRYAARARAAQQSAACGLLDRVTGKRVVVSLDGGRVRVRRKKRGPKTKKGRNRFHTDWKEPKLLILYVVGDDGRPSQTWAPIIDGTLRGPEAVFALLLSYARQVGLNVADKVLFIADGAPWIWRRLQRLIAALGLSPTQVLGLIDFYHAAKQLSDAVKLRRWSATQRTRWLNRTRGLLKRARVDEVITALRELCRGRTAGKIRTHLNYFLKNRHPSFPASSCRPHFLGPVPATPFVDRLRAYDVGWAWPPEDAVDPVGRAGVDPRRCGAGPTAWPALAPSTVPAARAADSEASCRSGQLPFVSSRKRIASCVARGSRLSRGIDYSESFSSPLGESFSAVRTGTHHPDCRSTAGETSARSFRPSASTTLRTVSKFGTRSPDSAL